MKKIYISRKAYLKLKYFVTQCEEEISGLGKLLVSKRDNGDSVLIVYDFEIFDQVVSGAHSTIDDDSLAKFLFEKTKAGENLAVYRVWWHSHAAMATFFSGTDTNTIDNSTEFPYLVSIVTNHKLEFKARIDIYSPIRVTEELEIEKLDDEDEELKALCLKEIEEKVKKEVVVNHRDWWKEDKDEKKDQKTFLHLEDDPDMVYDEKLKGYRPKTEEEKKAGKAIITLDDEDEGQFPFRGKWPFSTRKKYRKKYRS